MAKAKKANPSTKRSPAAQALWRWLRTAGTYLRVFVRGIVYLLWSKSWIVFTPLGVLLAVFLFSYSPSDPAFTFTTDAQASNWGGVVGAWVSDCLLSAFGFSAWWFVLASFMSAVFAFRSQWRQSRGERDPERLRPPKLSSAFGFVVLLVGSSSLEALRLRRFETSLPGNPGGVLGDWLAFAVEHYIGVGLATVVFFVLIGMGLSLLMDFEWMSVCERVGRLLDFLIFEPIGKLLNRKKEEKIKELQEFVSRFSANKSKSKQATARRKLLDKLTVEEMPCSTRRYPFVGFQAERELGKDVLTVKDVSVTVDGVKLLDKVYFSVNRTDKIAFVGENELAQTALFKILMGELEPDEGSVKWGVSTIRSYLPKDNSAYFDGNDMELVDWLRALVAGGVDPARIEQEIPFAGVLLKKDKDLQTLRKVK